MKCPGLNKREKCVYLWFILLAGIW